MFKQILLPNYILVGHAAGVVHAAKNTIRMAALTGRLPHKESPWGLVVNTKKLAELYPLRGQFVRVRDGVAWEQPVTVESEE